jgi:hypothetical protein
MDSLSKDVDIEKMNFAQLQVDLSPTICDALNILKDSLIKIKNSTMGKLQKSIWTGYVFFFWTFPIGLSLPRNKIQNSISIFS